MKFLTFGAVMLPIYGLLMCINKYLGGDTHTGFLGLITWLLIYAASIILAARLANIIEKLDS